MGIADAYKPNAKSGQNGIEDFARRIPGVGQIVDMFDPAHPGEEEARQIAALYENLKYIDPKSDPEYAKALNLLDTYAHGTLTAEDRAREYEAAGEAQKFAAGETGAIAQEAAARGGGGSGVNSIRQQLAAQDAAKRLGSADVATSGMAAQRAFAAQQEFTRQMQMNTKMQNDFAQWKTGGQAGAVKNIEDLKLAQAESERANRDAMTNTIAGFAMGGVPIPTAPKQIAPMQTGYAADGNAGISLPGPTSLPPINHAATPPVDFGSAPTTADAAARAYSAFLSPFSGMAEPGSAPSVSSDDPRRRPTGGY